MMKKIFWLNSAYFSKLSRMCKKLSFDTGLPYISLLCDYISSYILHGCSINQYSSGKFYLYRGGVRRRIVTFKRSIKIWELFNEKRSIHYFENKTDFNKTFADYVVRDWIPSCESVENVRAFVERHESFILKPIDSLQGQGVRLVTSENLDVPSFLNEVGKNMLLEEVIEQHPEMGFGNKSVNTIRVFTILDKNGDVRVLKAVCRAGKGDCVIDNFCAGGCLYPIDIETGIIEEKGVDMYGNKYLYHPGTDICMLGYKIPNWEKVIETVTEAAKVVPQCRYIGWDVAILNDGVELIEGNHNPDHDLLEFVGGERMFYKKIMQYK